MSIGRPLLRFDVVTSTMDIASALATRGARDGTLVLADGQTLGQGRSGRAWMAERGSSLMLSVILRPDRPFFEHGQLSLLAGLAVAKTIESFIARPTSIKWPNDVLIDNRKASGVLLHAHPANDSIKNSLVLGIGINVNSTPDSLPDGATSLRLVSGKTIPLDDVLGRLISELDDVYTGFLAGDVSVPWRALNNRLAFRDQGVVVRDGNRTLTGIVCGIGERGELLLRQEDGRLRPVVSGELTRGPHLATA